MSSGGNHSMILKALLINIVLPKDRITTCDVEGFTGTNTQRIITDSAALLSL